MIFNIPFSMITNVNNDIQISISLGTEPGQRVRRDSYDEFSTDSKGRQLFTQHPDKPHLITNPINYVLMQGKTGIRYSWNDGDTTFNKSHIQDYIDFMESNGHPDFVSRYNVQYDDNNIWGEYEHRPTETSGFFKKLEWQPYTRSDGVEILQHDTVLVCPMQYQAGWTFDRADVMNGDTLHIERAGSERCYIIAGQLLSTPEGKRVEKYKLTQLESVFVDLKNNSGTFCTVARIYK